MARGRMLNKKICRDLDVHNLSDDTCRLLFSWLITHLDKEGRTNGDPSIVKSNVFPRRTDLSIEIIENYLIELDYACLIFRYENNGDLYIWFPGFEENQPGLRKDREPDSEIPPPTAEQMTEFIRRDDGNHPDNIRINVGLKEGKGIEVKGINPSSSPSLLGIFTKVTGMMAIPSSEMDKVLPALEILIRKYQTEQDLIDYLKPFYIDWNSRKTRDGRRFSRTNCAWLYDWSVTGAIPDKSTESTKDKKEIQVDADGGMYL